MENDTAYWKELLEKQQKYWKWLEERKSRLSRIKTTAEQKLIFEKQVRKIRKK